MTVLLRNLVALLEEESDRNPAFAARLDEVLTPVHERKLARPKAPKSEPIPLPDLHAELAARGESEFRHWLRKEPLPVMRALIRAHDLDPARRTTKWKEAEKVADFIVDALRARLARGSAFIGRVGGA